MGNQPASGGLVRAARDGARRLPRPPREPAGPGGPAPSEADIEAVGAALRGDVGRLRKMLELVPKVATLLGHMHWTLLRFGRDRLATSDCPVVPWPLADRVGEPGPLPWSGIREMVEIRFAVSPRLALVMTWLDEDDRTPPRTATAHHDTQPQRLRRGSGRARVVLSPWSVRAASLGPQPRARFDGSTLTRSSSPLSARSRARSRWSLALTPMAPSARASGLASRYCQDRRRAVPGQRVTLLLNRPSTPSIRSRFGHEA